MKQLLMGMVIGICIVPFLLIIQRALGIDDDTFFYGFLIIALIILARTLKNIFYIKSYAKKLSKFAAPLDVEEAKEFISTIETLLQTAKGRKLRNALKINLAVGYISVKQFDTALHILEGLAHEHLRITAMKLCYLTNLYIGYICTEQYDKAMELYKANKKFFESHRKDKAYGGSIAIIQIFEVSMSGQYEQAESLLQIAKQTWTAPHLQDALEKMESFLLEMKTMDRP